MSIKTKELRVCDECGKELTKPFVKVTDVPHEGCSKISIGKLYYMVGPSDFCSLDCLFNNIKAELEN